MKKMTEMFSTGFRNACIGAVGLGVSASSFAAVDTTAVGAAIADSQSKGEEVGGYVIAAVAALVVISVIIGVVHKMR